MSDPIPPDRLPESLYTFFWDVDASRVNPKKSPQYVITRLLDIGNVFAVKWAFSHFSQKIILENLLKSRSISFRTANFWSKYFRVNRKDFLCMQEPYYSMRKMHWPY